MLKTPFWYWREQGAWPFPDLDVNPPGCSASELAVLLTLTHPPESLLTITKGVGRGMGHRHYLA